MTTKQPHHCITYHAVTRYVQRVLHVTVDGQWKDEKSRARAHCAAVDATIEQVRLLIWTPGIALAVKMGFCSVGCRDFEARIQQPEGVIATIQAPRGRDHRRIMIRSDRELQQQTKRRLRQNRRRPSSAIGKKILEEEL